MAGEFWLCDRFWTLIPIRVVFLFHIINSHQTVLTIVITFNYFYGWGHCGFVKGFGHRSLNRKCSYSKSLISIQFLVLLLLRYYFYGWGTVALGQVWTFSTSISMSVSPILRGCCTCLLFRRFFAYLLAWLIDHFCVSVSVADWPSLRVWLAFICKRPRLFFVSVSPFWDSYIPGLGHCCFETGFGHRSLYRKYSYSK